MKDKCSIARDLMPLVIDGACSEESSKFVKEHVSECPPCAEIWGEMKTELPRVTAEKEKAELDKAARAMKKKRRKRAWLTTIVAVVTSIVLLWGGQWLYDELTLYTRVPMDKDEYTVQLYKMSDGTGLIVYDLAQNNAQCGIGWGGGDSVINLRLYEPVIQLGNDRTEKLYGGYRTAELGGWNEQGWMNVSERQMVAWAVEGRENYLLQEPIQQIWVDYGDGQELIYTHGDEVPTCSPEMEAYLDYLHNPPDIGKGKYGMEYDYDKLAELRAAVPEWQ